MCYAIPGKVIAINNNLVTVEYFGEKKTAKNDFFSLTLGDYVYAQGGFVIQKMKESDALSILEGWQELFFQLQKRDIALSSNPKTLYQRANFIRNKYLGNACCVHGIIEFSSYCRNDCLYCGLRSSNAALVRYRMEIDEIVETAQYSFSELGFKALVLQSGEDTWYDREKLVRIVREVRKRAQVFLILSIGERDLKIYEELYQEGARGALLRFETSNSALYSKMRPGHALEDRLGLIKKLAEIGYLVMTGFLIGLPGQNQEDLMRDIELCGSLNPEMFSFGPFIPHPKTPLVDEKLPSLDVVLETIARTRLKFPESKILATTATATLDKEGLKLALLAGANSLMINVTPPKYQPLYELYPNRQGLGISLAEQVSQTVRLLESLGRAPTDLGL
jgi:biotin synthase